jgi:glycosyltransferase involved in cell wall biosynthesis
MSSKPRVSVVTPFLNGERFIREAIESVFAQTYDRWELLLVDDGSTDGSTDIALRYAKQYPGKVRYLEHDAHRNRGASASRNLGISHSQGEYIALLDADDVWLPRKLEQQVVILDSQPEAGMLYGNTQYWYSWTGNPEDVQRDFMPSLGVQPNTLVKPPTLLPLFLLRKAPAPCTCSALVRREVIAQVGGFEDAFRYICTDQVFFAKLFLKTPVFVSGGCWDRYRQHPDSCYSMVKQTGQEKSTWLLYLHWLEKYLSDQGIRNIEVRRSLQQALWPYHHPILSHLLEPQYLVTQVKGLVKLIAQRTLPIAVRHWLRERG